MKIKLKNGTTVEVYPHSERNTYVNAQDCKTEYNANEVKVISK